MKNSLLNKMTAIGMASLVALPFIKPKLASAQEIAAGINVDIVSSWMWRGDKVGGLSIQPSAYVAFPNGLTGIVWSSDNTETERFDEVDVAGEYTKNVRGAETTVGINRFGYIGADDATEVYGRISLPNLPLSPKVFAAYNLTDRGTYVEASGSKDLIEGITASAAIGCKDNYYGNSKCPSHLDLRLQKELEIRGFRIAPGVQWTIGDDNNVTGILSIGKDF